MTDYSKAKISLTLFSTPVEEKSSDRYPDSSGYFEITLADLDEFYQLAKAVEPTLNYKNEPAVALKIATWDKVGAHSGKRYQSCSVEPKPQTRFKPIAEPLISPTTPAQVLPDDEVI